MKKVAAFGVTAIGLAFLAWRLWPTEERRPLPLVLLPNGVSLMDVLRNGKHAAPKGWFTNRYLSPDQSGVRPEFRDRVKEVNERIQWLVHEAIGESLAPVPTRPTLLCLEPRLCESSQTSGETYLVAKEFFAEDRDPARQSSEWTLLGFIFGSTKRPRHSQDRIAMIEDEIIQNGVITYRLRSSPPKVPGGPPIKYIVTNQCAIIRDTPGFVKIVPLDSLRSYVEAGLVRMSND